MDKVSQAAVRDINRKLQQDRRDDWDFPRPSVHSFQSPLATAADTYRVRYYGTTDEEDLDEGLIMGEGEAESSEEEQDPYQFDSPDSVGGIVESKLQAKRRKRRERLEQEIEINEGLRFFLARRNAWTGAVKVQRPPSQQDHGRQASTGSDSGFSSAHTENTAPSSPATASSSSPAAGPRTTLEEHLRITSISQDSQSPSYPNATPSALLDVAIPVTRPLIAPTDAVRMSMYSRQPSELYEKIVRDTRSPAIPINLAHMTRVIVQGWKDEGNWPPSSFVPEPSIASSRRMLGFGAVTDRKNRVQQGLRDRASRDSGRKRSARGHTQSAAQQLETDVNGVPVPHGIFAHHPGKHIRQGIDGVKRVLRLSGSHGSSRPKSTDSKSTVEPLSPRSPKSPLSPKMQSLDTGGN